MDKKNGINTLRVSTNEKDLFQFSLKSSFMIVGSLSLFSLVIPYFLWQGQMDIRPVVVLGNGLFTSFTVAYTRCFVDSKRGFGKTFYLIFGFFAAGIFMLGYCWLYLNIFM